MTCVEPENSVVLTKIAKANQRDYPCAVVVYEFFSGPVVFKFIAIIKTFRILHLECRPFPTASVMNVMAVYDNRVNSDSLMISFTQ